MESARRKSLVAKIPVGDSYLRQLTLAADHILFRAKSQGDESKTVIAGYHCSVTGGRDTMIAFARPYACHGRHDDARSILETFAASLDMGMLPNRFSDYGEAAGVQHVDATLWFFHAASNT